MAKSVCIVQTNRSACDTYARIAAEVLPNVDAYQVVDDSLVAHIRACGGLTPAITRRLYNCYLQAQEMGASFALHTCIAAGDAVEAIQPLIDIPIVRIDRPMMLEALGRGADVSVFAVGAIPLRNSAAFLEKLAADARRPISVTRHLLAAANEAALAGDVQRQRLLVRAEAEAAAAEGRTVVLAQPGMSSWLEFLDDLDVPVLAALPSGFTQLEALLAP